jgi:hypothetical protein
LNITFISEYFSTESSYDLINHLSFDNFFIDYEKIYFFKPFQKLKVTQVFIFFIKLLDSFLKLSSNGQLLNLPIEKLILSKFFLEKLTLYFIVLKDCLNGVALVNLFYLAFCLIITV